MNWNRHSRGLISGHLIPPKRDKEIGSAIRPVMTLDVLTVSRAAVVERRSFMGTILVINDEELRWHWYGAIQYFNQIRTGRMK